MDQNEKLKIDFEIEIISNIQICLMNLLNTHGIVYDVDGNIINETNNSLYCRTLRFISEGRDRCRSYSWELSKSAICFKKPFEDKCPGGLKLLSIPIYLNENVVIGAHCVAISSPLHSKFSVYDIADRFGIDAQILWDAVKKTPLMQRPVLKIAREHVVLTTELISKILARIYTLKQGAVAMKT